MSSEFKIYTRTGDAGETTLIGGDRVQKNHPRITAYGDVDELKSWIGLIRDQDIDMLHKRMLLEIEDRLFTLESHLATPLEETRVSLPQLSDKDILKLELEIDRMNDSLAPLTSFILPGGCAPASMCHVGRTVCRRAERSIITMGEQFPVVPLAVKYINRLSDYLFVLARMVTKETGGVETPWMPRR
jgi:cob(I)alamin adenosyltransferase